MATPDAERELHLVITSITDAAVARALVLRFALDQGFERQPAAEAAIVASELVSNVVKYAGDGELMVSVDGSGLLISTFDRGPGPPSEAELFADGVSRGVTRMPDQSIATGLGTGGGAIRRLCDDVQLCARPGGGSIIRCHKRR
jgi:anti-sigma regulatory factor (Ser/Thr protein kinase)